MDTHEAAPAQTQTQGQGQNPTTPPPKPDPPHPHPQSHPDLAKPPAAAGEARPAPIWVDPADHATTQAELQNLREFKRQQDQLLEMKENERVRLLAEKGQLDEAFKSLTERHEKKVRETETRAKSIESKWLGERVGTEIQAALAGRAFAGTDPKETAAMVRALLEAEVEAVLDPQGNPTVRDRTTLRPAAEYLKERLESPRFAIFFLATTRGGSGTDAARPAAATPAPAGTFEAFAKEFRDRQAQYQDTRYLKSQSS